MCYVYVWVCVCVYLCVCVCVCVCTCVCVCVCAQEREIKNVRMRHDVEDDVMSHSVKVALRIRKNKLLFAFVSVFSCCKNCTKHVIIVVTLKGSSFCVILTSNHHTVQYLSSSDKAFAELILTYSRPLLRATYEVSILELGLAPWSNG